MTFLHLLVLALGIVAAVALADVLSHRGIGPWPIGLGVLVLVPIAGWLYSSWLAALALGLAVGISAVLVVSWTRTFVRHRRLRREQARARREAREAQLGLTPPR